MAPQWAWWTLMKLRHPFTPDDLLVSRQLLSSLELPSSTSQFVVALRDPQSPEKVVYVLAVEKLSERSIEDIYSLVEAVNPGSVVAFVDAQYMSEALEEGDLLNSQASPDVPTSFLHVIRTCFTEKIKASGYESRAGLRVLTNIFGTTFYGNVFAARKAAEKAQADFQYLRFPSTAITSFSEDEEEDVKDVPDVREDGAVSTFSSSDRFLDRFSSLLGGGNYESLTSASQRVTTLPRSSQGPQELRALAPAVASNLTNKVVVGLPSAPADSRREKSTEAAEDDDCPSFAVPFYPLFLDLHELFKETPGVNQALNYARKLLVSVEQGEQVDYEDVSRARLFRVAVESVRLCWQSFVRSEWRPSAFSSKAVDFSQLPFEEKCHALLAQALQRQAQKFSSVVAVVDASSVPGIRRHWNTAIPPEVAAYAEYCFVGLDGEEGREEGRTLSSFFESPETKAAVMVSAGAAGAVAAGGMCCLPQWASFPAVVKVFTFKVPTVLKLAWMQMKRQAVVGWASTKAVMPAALKATGSGKAILAPSSSTAKAALLKSTAGAEKARIAAHGVVTTAERASLQAIRTAFYNLMRSRQARTLGSRPWMMMGSSLATAGVVMCYGEEIEHAISIVPQAPAVVRLGRGLENLEQASKVVDNYEDTRWWNRVYSALYRRPQPL